MAFKKTAGQQSDVVNFGDRSMYTAGGGPVPEGDYIFKDVSVMMYQATSKDGVAQGAERLSVCLQLESVSNPSEEIRPQYYSLGGKAHESFQPSEDGKSLVSVPGGPGRTLQNNTKWAMLLDSLYNSGLPEGVFTGNVSVLDGMSVHMQNIPEPASWGDIQGRTGEASGTRKPGVVSVVTEIKDGGKPWETGFKRSKSAPASIKAAPAAAAPSGDLEELATEHISSVLENNADGMKKIALKNEVFKSIGDPATGNKVRSEVLNNEATLTAILESLGYKIQGVDVVVA